LSPWWWFSLVPLAWPSGLLYTRPRSSYSLYEFTSCPYAYFVQWHLGLFLSVRSFGSFLVCQLGSVIVSFLVSQDNCLVFARRAISVLTSWMLTYALPTLTASGEKIDLVFCLIWEFLSVRLTSSRDCFCFASSVPIISWCCLSEVGSRPFAAYWLPTAISDIL
jgi:hypothetical protein